MLALAALVVARGVTEASAPMAKGQAPGWFRMKLGDFEVTALSDGTLEMPIDQFLTNTTPEKVKKAMAAAFLKSPVESSFNSYLINTGPKLVLIDTGAASAMGPTLGKLLQNLRASGYKPEQVDEVYITHMHGDHIGGLLAGDKAAFPNAVLRTAKAESDYWLSAANAEKAPENMKGFFKAAAAAFKPYIAAGKHKTFEGADVELVPGVHAIATPGHTPGHTVYAVESKGEKLVLWGDLMHVAAVQLPDPSVTIQFDSDSKAAAAQRKKQLAEAAAKGSYVGIAHVSFPGIGHLRAEGAGYVWVPVNYTTK
jgi:glyoxylase-like metal-dependent hydrolase (beta-lactamase superfamily II)